MVLHTFAVQSALRHWFAPLQAEPVGSLAEHVPSLAQKSPDGQSASLVHPPAVAHVIVVWSQLSLRHCSESLQDPSPGASPQALSFGSQTPDLHTLRPTSGEQVATVSGVDGKGVPLSILGMHVPRVSVVPLHQLEASQSASTWQPVTHSPLLVSQMLPA